MPENQQETLLNTPQNNVFKLSILIGHEIFETDT